MTANGDFVRSARAVLDAVTGRDRLSRFSKRSSLACIDAIVSNSDGLFPNANLICNVCVRIYIIKESSRVFSHCQYSVRAEEAGL